MLPHLEGEVLDPVWRRFKDTWFGAKEKVAAYTEARHVFDREFFTKMDTQIKSVIGEEFQADWSDQRMATQFDNHRRYQAAGIRDSCEYWYEGRYELPGWRWWPASVGSGNQLGGAPWAITQSNGSLPYLWGGPVPDNLQVLSDRMNETLDALRHDEGLKALFSRAEAAHAEAKVAVAPLQNAADDAAHLLRHGPDIPGECAYCKAWHPRY